MRVPVIEVFRIILLVHTVLLSADAQSSCRPQEHQLYSVGQTINITSPNYPGAYTPGTTCRYRIRAPFDHVIVLNCFFEVYPNSCGTENFHVSLDGDLEFRDGEAFCSSSTVRRTSHFRTIAFAYRSTAAATNLRGRFFCQASARRQACGCGWTISTKITNGQEAARNEYPAMVALRDVTSPQRVFCGGSIISRRHILSAAHCIRVQPDASRVLAYLGDHDLTSDTESNYAVQHRIQRIINHPRYDSSDTNSANDIALYITMMPIEWTRGVGPICLPMRQVTEAFSYRNVDVAGWGTISFAGPKSNTLQKVQLLTMENRICQEQYNSTILRTHICTYDFRGLGQDSCQYDSGGPVIYRQERMFLIGVISFGRDCGVRYAIGVNTRVTAHLNWIGNSVGVRNICDA